MGVESSRTSVADLYERGEQKERRSDGVSIEQISRMVKQVVPARIAQGPGEGGELVAQG